MTTETPTKDVTFRVPGREAVDAFTKAIGTDIRINIAPIKYEGRSVIDGKVITVDPYANGALVRLRIPAGILPAEDVSGMSIK